MVFSSLMFMFCFLPAVILLYFAVPDKLKNTVLFICSLIFYAWGEPVYVVLMLFSTVVDYTHGRLVDKYKRSGQDKKARRALASSVIINLALLCFFKYADFAVGTVNSIFGTSIAALDLPLPIGISFYTFQTMSYTIDVYRGQAKVQNNIISFGAYVSLFPQLIAGPIVRYQTVAEALNRRKTTADKFSDGVMRFVVGLGKKVLIANNIGLIWDSVSALDFSTLTVLEAWLGIIAFTFQLYFDFSGYSDMAIGLGKIFGFDFPENFDHPYMSRSVTEFWRRWHISLGMWFREYLYIPLGGNRCSKAKWLRNIAIVWLLTGLWHGAGWNFVAWGAYFSVLLIIEKLFLLKRLEKLPSAVRRGYTFLLVVFSWVMFSIDKMPDILKFFGAMFGVGRCGFANTDGIYMLLTNVVLLAVAVLGSTELPLKLSKEIKGKLSERPVVLETVKTLFIALVMLLSVAYLVDSSFNPFLYFRF
ncbi:MAG: MBOAT family protein [Clostridiales bacterium]|nr:MBOAT family protein [Clostridiales bacterium]